MSRPQRGQATVELVLVLPVLVTLVLATVQLGLLARDRVLLAHATREAARAVAVDPRPAVALAAARSATGLEPTRLTVELGPARMPGDRLTVVVRYRAPTRVPVVGVVLPDVDLESTVTVRVE